MELFKLFGSFELKGADEAKKDIEDVDQAGEKVGGRMSALAGIAATAGAALAAAFGAAVIGAVKGADDMNKAVNGLSASTGIWGEELDDMEGSMKNIYNNNFGESFQDIADTMAYAKQTTGAFGEELEYLTQDALMLRDTFGIDTTESLRAAKTMMEQFGTTGTDAMAIVAEATQKGLNKSGDLVDTIEEYSVYFKTAGLDYQDMMAVFENASSAGVRNLDFVGDAFKEMVIRTKDGSDTTKQAFKDLGLNADQMGKDFAAGGDKGRDAFLKMMDALKNMEDPMKRNEVGVALFGTKFEDLEAKGVLAMGNLNGSIKGSVDTLNEINEIKYDSFGEAMQGIGRNLQTGILIPIGEKLLPYLNQFAQWLMEKVPVIQQFFSNMFSSGKSAFDGISSAVRTVIDFLKPYIMDFITMIKEWWNQNGQELMANFKTVWDGIMAVIQFILPFLRVLFETFITAIKNIIKGGLDFISGLFKFFASLLKGDMSGMWEGLKQMFSGAIQFIWGLVNLNFVRGILNLITGFKGKAFGYIKGLWDDIAKKFSGGKDDAVRTVGSLKDTVLGIFGNIKTKAQEIFNNIKKLMQDPIKAAKDFIKEQVDKIVGFFNGMKIKFPKIKLPHFSLKGEFSLTKMTVPSVGVEWYKDGGVFAPNDPRLIGIGDAKVPEAAIPLSDSVLGKIGAMIANTMPQPQVQAAGGTQEIVINLDSYEIARVTNPHIDKMQGNRSESKARFKGVRST